MITSSITVAEAADPCDLICFHYRGEEAFVTAGKCSSILVTFFDEARDQLPDVDKYKGLYAFLKTSTTVHACCTLCAGIGKISNIKLEYSQAKFNTPFQNRGVKFGNFKSHMFTAHPNELSKEDWKLEWKSRNKNKKETKKSSSSNSQDLKVFEVVDEVEAASVIQAMNDPLTLKNKRLASSLNDAKVLTCSGCIF